MSVNNIFSNNSVFDTNFLLTSVLGVIGQKFS